MQQALLIFTNMPDVPTAETVARELVERRLAACVNLLPAVRSIYRWQGTIEEAQEITLLAKTSRACYPELEATIRSMHPYQLPEIIAVPVEAGLPAYLDWIELETKRI